MWTAARADDFFHVRPESVTVVDRVLEVRIWATKTAGVGERARTAMAWVTPDAWLVHFKWLSARNS